LFLAKYNSSGNFLWVRNADSATGNRVATDSYGNVLITGSFSKSTVFGNHSIAGIGYSDIFLVKYDSLGNVLWVKSEGGANNNFGNGVAIDAHGNIYVTGYFEETTVMGTDTLQLNPSYLASIFLAKYNASGNVIWAKAFGGNGGNLGYSVATDALGNVYLTSGTDAPSITFGTFTLQLAPLANAYYTCVTKHDSLGNTLCATAIPGGGNGGSGKLAIDNFGHAYIGGYFSNDPFVIGNNTLHLGAGGLENIFIAKVLMDCSSSPACVPAVSYTLTPDTIPHTWDAYPTYLANTTSAKWYWGDGSSTIGFYPSHTYTVAGHYNICVSVYSVCGDSAQSCQNDSIYRLANNTSSNMVYINVKNSTTGINKISNNNTIKIYPNPAQNKITIDATDVVEIKLVDVLGKQITSTKTNDVDVSNLNDGVYFIQVQTKQGTTTQKIIVQH